MWSDRSGRSRGLRRRIGGCGDVPVRERLDFSTVLLRVLPCPAVCERFSGSDQPWLPCAMCVARGPVSVCRCRTRTAARRAVGTRTSSPCGRSSPPATVAGSTRAPRASAPARSCAPDRGRTLTLNPGGPRPPGFVACTEAPARSGRRPRRAAIAGCLVPPASARRPHARRTTPRRRQGRRAAVPARTQHADAADQPKRSLWTESRLWTPRHGRTAGGVRLR
jgi:hypothetical protein